MSKVGIPGSQIAAPTGTALRRVAGGAAVAELEEAIGAAPARDFAREFGGTRVYVPRTIPEHHPIRVAIGRDGADKLAAFAGGGSIEVPKQTERRSRVLELAAQSLTRGQIARASGYSERHVRRLLVEAGYVTP